MALIAPPSAPPVEPDDGVIEEARGHQRRRWWKTAGAAGGLAAIAAVLLLMFLGGSGGPPLSRLPVPFSAQPQRLSFKDGLTYLNGQPMLVGVAPDFTAGEASLDVRLYNEGAFGVGYPTAAAPAFGPGALADWAGKVGPFVVLVTREVASLRVSGLGTFTPHRVLGLPPNVRAITFLAPPGSQATVLPPGDNQLRASRSVLHETAYSTSGRPIAITQPGVRWDGAFHLPSRSWHAPAAEPTSGRCAIRSSLAGVALQWGEVATTISPYPQATGPAFLSCLQAWYHWHGLTFDVGVLANAKSPGSTPAMLWNAKPIPGHPGMVEIRAVEYVTRTRIPRLSAEDFATFTFRTAPGERLNPKRIRALRQRAFNAHKQQDERLAALHNRRAGQILVTRTILAFPGVAERAGSAWIVVRDGNNLNSRIQFLAGLHLTRLNLAHT